MKARVLTTDGGPHSPMKWALATAEHITPFNDDASPEDQLAALKLRAAIVEALVPHHHANQKHERNHLAEHGSDHLANPIDVSPDAAVTAVVEAAKGTRWEAQFVANAPVLRQEIGNHFATAHEIERQWHCDRNPTCPKARAYKGAN